MAAATTPIKTTPAGDMGVLKDFLTTIVPQ